MYSRYTIYNIYKYTSVHLESSEIYYNLKIAKGLKTQVTLQKSEKTITPIKAGTAVESDLCPSHSLWETCPRAALQGSSQVLTREHLEQNEPVLWAGFRHIHSSHKGTKTPKNTLLKNPGNIFIYKHRILCTFLKGFFFFCIFINEREMLSDSPLKGCKSTSLQINFHLSAVYAMSYF